MKKKSPEKLTYIVWFVGVDGTLIGLSTNRRRFKLWSHNWFGSTKVKQFIPPKEIHIIMSSVIVHDDQPDFGVRAVFQDADGNTTLPDDIPQWASSAENIASVVPSVDGTSALVKIAGGIGIAEITCTSTDTNGTKIVISGTVDVTAGEAVRGDLVFDVTGTPTAAPAPVAVASADTGTSADTTPPAPTA